MQNVTNIRHISSLFLQSTGHGLVSIERLNNVKPVPLQEAIRNVGSSTVCRDTSMPPVAIENVTKQLKKRAYKKRVSDPLMREVDGKFVTVAFATADSYDLTGITKALMQQNLYETVNIPNADVAPDVVHAIAKYKVGDEPREIFFLEEGATVFWNCSELESNNVLKFLKPFENESYPEDIVLKEKEEMSYSYQSNLKKCVLQDSNFLLVAKSDNILEKYTFSNALAQSVKLGIWEETLNRIANSVQSITGDMERGHQIKLSRKDVVRQTGRLLSLRHQINVESDLLDTPDFYWEQQELEKLYGKTITYFNIPRRTRVLNERLSHCVELMELLDSWLGDKHHIRLEWMIIALIMVEVVFEILHFGERFRSSTEPVA